MIQLRCAALVLVFLHTAGTATGQVWGYCASTGKYLRLVGGFTSPDFRLGSTDVGATCHRGIYAREPQNMSDTSVAFYSQTGALFKDSDFCVASTSTCNSCIGSPRCLSKKMCPFDCSCTLSHAGAAATNTYFGSHKLLEFTGAFIVSGAVSKNFSCSASWNTSEYVSGYTLAVMPSGNADTQCAVDDSAAMYREWSCSLNVSTRSNSLQANESFAQSFIINAAVSFVFPPSFLLVVPLAIFCSVILSA